MSYVEDYTNEEHLSPVSNTVSMAPTPQERNWGVSCDGLLLAGRVVRWWVVAVVVLVVIYLLANTQQGQASVPQVRQALVDLGVTTGGSMPSYSGAVTQYTTGVNPELRQMLGMGSW
jgi:hypothetical protein